MMNFRTMYDEDWKVTTDENKAVVKILNGVDKKYFIKKAGNGLNSGKFYDVIDKSSPYNNLLAKNPNTDEPLFKFAKVSEKVFEMYERYVRERKEIFLNFAEKQHVEDRL